MELLDVPRASMDALQRVYRPKDYPTREEIEALRSSGIVWLHPRQRLTRPLRHSERQKECDAAMTALEALARSRLVSYGEWLAAIEALWPKQIKILRQLRLLERELTVGVVYCPSSHWRYIRSYDSFLRPRPQDSGASGYDEEKKSAIPVRLALRSVNYAGETWHWELWMKACEAVEAAYELFWRQCSHHLSGDRAPLYRFVEVEIDLASDFHEWPEADILTLFRRFAVCGVRVLRKLKPRSTWVRRDVAPQLIPLVQDLMATSGAPHQRREGLRAFERIRVWLQSDAQLVDSVFSAITASHSIRHVMASTVSIGVDGDSSRAWQWLAVVFRQSIQDIDIECQRLAMDHVNTLENALRAQNPLSLLFPSTMIPVDETEDAFVTSAGYFRLYPPPLDTISTDNSDSTLIYDAPLENLQVISVDDNWVSVLLPGWGRAWVSHADVSLSRMKQQSQTPRVDCGPRRLSLTNLRSDQAPVVLALLRQIGERIQSISLSSFPGHFLSRIKFVSATPFIESVLLTCPNLQELTVKTMSLPSLSIFTRAYNDHSLRAQHLFLEKVDIEDRAESLQFFKTLADPAHPMVTHLRSFSCTLSNRTDYFPNIRPTILHMLQHNTYLDEFQLDPGDARSAVGPDDTIRQEEVDEINGGRLPLQCQLAFLSVVEGHNTENCEAGRRAIHSLDRDLMTAIFQFATSVRFVRVEFWR